jgi:uncharacterized protein YyaL (SSP411 family)
MQCCVLQARKAKREADAAQEEAAIATERANAKEAKLQDDSAAAAEARAAAEAARDDLQVTNMNSWSLQACWPSVSALQHCRVLHLCRPLTAWQPALLFRQPNVLCSCAGRGG